MSDKRKLFIHIQKSAGMTIRHSPVLHDKIIIAERGIHKPGHADAVKKVMDANGDHHGWEHARLRDIQTSITDNHTSFAIIRNPWDRVVSRYFFAKKVIEVEKKAPTSYADVSSFEAFLEERFIWGGKDYYWHRAIRNWYPAREHVINHNNRVSCDILTFENLNEELCKYFSIPNMSRARNVTGLNSGTYMDMYTPATIQIIADWYKDDIDTWGFDFDTPATKNTYYLD